MAINLSTLILKVQNNLSDVPSDYITDEQIYNDLKTSQGYINYIMESEFTDENFISLTIVALSTYYSYINYTSLAERQLGTLPPTSEIKARVLKERALAFMKQLSKFELNDDLTTDNEQFMVGGIGYGISKSALTFYEDL